MLKELRRSEPVLWRTGCFMIPVIVICLIGMPFDTRQVTGTNPWLKPFKFAVSILIYVWTLGWFLRFVEGAERSKQAVRWGVSLAMTGEILLITLQAARGVPSHFNVESAFDAVVFSLMGLFILLNTFLVALALLLLLVWPSGIQPAYLMGIRMGLLVFLIGSLEGMVMILNQAHAVGVRDGGPGLPFLNWSTQAGDLRAPHAFALHALQGLPLIGYAISRWCRARPVLLQLALVSLAGFGWLAVFLALFARAVAGLPVIG